MLTFNYKLKDTKNLESVAWVPTQISSPNTITLEGVLYAGEQSGGKIHVYALDFINGIFKIY